MTSKPRSQPNTSIRLWPELEAELDTRVSRGGIRSELINQFAIEGMRMDAHPGIVFRDGPVGRRPGLVDGPDVWEIARVVREVKPRGEAAIEATARATGLSNEQAATAVAYYAAYRSEVDAWIEMVDAEAEMLEAAWRQRMDVLA